MSEGADRLGGSLQCSTHVIESSTVAMKFWRRVTKISIKSISAAYDPFGALGGVARCEWAGEMQACMLRRTLPSLKI